MANEDILRMRYTEGQFLSAADFTDEQSYLIESRRRHYISEHTWGVVSGLGIEKNTGGVWVVRAGVGIDGYGREICLFEDEPLDTTEIAAQLAGQANATLQIWLAYATEATSPAPAGYATCSTATANTRTRETFQLIYQDQPAPFDTQDPGNRTKWPTGNLDLSDDPSAQPWPLLLGTITWAAGGVTSVDSVPDARVVPTTRPDSSHAHYAGLRGSELFSQLDQFDLHAAKLRVMVEGANGALLTTSKVTGATGPAEFRINTNDDVGGNTVRVDKDNLAVTKDLSVDQKITVKGTVGNGSGQLTIEASTAQDLAVLTRPANTGASPAHDLAIRTNAGNGGNHILLDKDDVTVQNLTVAGSNVVKGGMELWGGELILKQADGSDDTDPISLSRFNNGPDRNDMRLQIGDNLDGQDRLVVGPKYFGDSAFKEQFSVDNLGNVKNAGSVNGRNMAADGAKLDGLPANANFTAILSGILNHGEIIPLPAGFTEAQCRWIVSPLTPDGFLTAFLHDFYCRTDGRTVFAQWLPFGLPAVAGTVNYLIIGVK